MADGCGDRRDGLAADRRRDRRHRRGGAASRWLPAAGTRPALRPATPRVDLARHAGVRPITGVGANKPVAVDDGGRDALHLLHSHATSRRAAAGRRTGPRDARRPRAQLAAGGSGVAPSVLDALVAMLRADALPLVREHGSLGTGDLSALATTALALLGDPRRVRPSTGTTGWRFISSNAATIADAALAVRSLQALATVAVAVAALTFAAVDGNVEAVHRRSSTWSRRSRAPASSAG